MYVCCDIDKIYHIAYSANNLHIFVLSIYSIAYIGCSYDV